VSGSKQIIMPKNKMQLEELLAFIKENRSNEANFEKIYDRLKAELSKDADQNNFNSNMAEIAEKQAETYRSSKETNGNAWPEFEKFVSAIEKTITGAIAND
jgi:hypothetical protein